MTHHGQLDHGSHVQHNVAAAAAPWQLVGCSAVVLSLQTSVWPALLPCCKLLAAELRNGKRVNAAEHVTNADLLFCPDSDVSVARTNRCLLACTLFCTASVTSPRKQLPAVTSCQCRDCAMQGSKQERCVARCSTAALAPAQRRTQHAPAALCATRALLQTPAAERVPASVPSCVAALGLSVCCCPFLLLLAVLGTRQHAPQPASSCAIADGCCLSHASTALKVWDI